MDRLRADTARPNHSKNKPKSTRNTLNASRLNYFTLQYTRVKLRNLGENYRRSLPMSRKNSPLVLGSVRKPPVKSLVVVTEFCFCTPRIDMQRC